MFDRAVTLPPPPVPWSAAIELGRVRHLVWSPYTLAVPGLPSKLSGLRVLHLTDLHVTPTWMPAWDVLLARIAENPPDLICISGDFVEKKYDCGPAIPTLMRLIDGLKSRLGIFGIFGNHDGEVLAAFVGDWPVRILCNETLRLTDGDAAIEIVGLHGVHPDDAEAFIPRLTPKPPGTLRLVMAHFPRQAVRLAAGVGDVVLAGHTHGGQVCLPGGWPPITHDPLPRRFAKGVHWLGDRWLSVGRGIGFSKYRVRTFCPADAIELTLVPGQPHS